MPNKDKQNWLQRLIMTGAMSENPAVMTAAGYRHTKDGSVVQDKQNDPEVKKLRGNIAKIGAAGAASAAPQILWKAYSNPVVSAGIDVATGNYGDAAIGLATDLIPGRKIIKSFGLFDKSKGRWDTERMIKLVKGSKDNVIKYLDNEQVLSNGLKDMAIAKRLGVDIMPTFGSKHAKHPIQFEAERLNDFENGNIGLSFRPEKDGPLKIESSLDEEIFESTGFHEFLHHGRFGAPDPDFVKYVEPTTKYYKWKGKKMLIPEELIDSERRYLYDYLTEINSRTNELYVNLAEIGRRMGLTPGQEYVGTDKFMEMISDFRKNNPDKQFIFDFVNMNKPKRVLKGLTGVYKNGGELDDILKHVNKNIGISEMI